MPSSVDEQRRQYAEQRARSVFTAYMTSHPTSTMAGLVQQGRLSPTEGYQLIRETAIDPKTGVDRADLLISTIQYEMSAAAQRRWPLSVVIVDLDDFRQINSELTHVGADEILREIASALRDHVRDSDDVLAGDGDVIRWGGEEFILLLVGANALAASAVAERIRIYIEKTFSNRRPEHRPITASFGVAEWRAETMRTVEDLLRAADGQLYRAKQGGKNRVCA